MESIQRKRKTEARQANEASEYRDDDILDNNILMLTCTTRITDHEGQPFRKLRLLVQANHCCSDFMEDVATLWGKSGLKFKVGKMVLYPEKSFKKLGVENGAEVVVTGGRD